MIDGGFLKAVEGSHPTDRRIRLLVSIQSVSGYARRFARTPTPTKYKACAECGQSFEQTIPTRRYCEKRCKKKVENRRRRAREKATV